jgi:hypothetical protein
MQTITTELCTSIYKLIYHGNRNICGWSQVLTPTKIIQGKTETYTVKTQRGICPMCNAKTVVLEIPTGKEER